jgi:hypothetical protein
MKGLSVKSAVRRSLFALVAGGALLATANVAAAANAAGADYIRQKQQQEQQGRAPAEAPAPRAAPQAAPQPRYSAPAAQGAQGAAPQSRGYRGGGGGDNNWRTYERGTGRPVVVGPPRGRQGPDARIVPPSRAYTRAPRYVPSLPPGHRRYEWRGTPYYYGGGHWYRPYQNRYVIVGAPVGMYVSYLPGSYNTVWVGGTRYYYADNVYYTYEPERRGYVVARSPYGDDEDSYEDEQGGDQAQDQDLFIYPMRGQNEQQQSDDRYECHRWAVKETHYDPTDSEYDRDDRSNYDRALTACLTGRGYSVK